ncbi:ACT domain-containing protein [Idiomarina seosinensis]|uniref:prephenate dehydratase n=1 Tax=Idiomarina seosinensis TaxID=281739 RepID=UPI00384E82B4
MQISESSLVTLGPAGTFSELAAQALIKQQSLRLATTLQDSVASVVEAISPTQLGLLPIENLTEGFVSPVVDALVVRPLTILAEIKLPIAFKLLANDTQPQSVWAQFVAAGQCRAALTRLSLPIIHTSSNGESMQQLVNADKPAAALVPAHIKCPANFYHLSDKAADTEHNETRFVLLSANSSAVEFDPQQRWKSSVLLIDDNDHPGLLVDSLSVFARRGINLTSIVSRPTGGGFGQYHFYIDFDGHRQQSHVAEALEQLAKLNQIRWLGSYQAA